MFDEGSRGGNQREDQLRKHALPLGLAIAAVIAFILRAATHLAPFAVIGLGFAIAAVVVAHRMRSSQAQKQALARFSTTPVDDAVRRQLLQDYLSQDLSYSRGRIESVTPYTAVLVYGKPVNHVLHLLATVFLCGLWLPVWILIAVSGGEKRRVLSVDRCGNVTRN